eukprot:TRINITY_DN13499_c0_g1_i1.p1 TRINITY_DN13499_c0_g1~~TRINITY_DN13499_c0_g1_i1.p1  ORF type:complete len:320 (-),score=88.33 TRINITY_DN13499_c0_g1_i1:229-1128(-)
MCIRDRYKDDCQSNYKTLRQTVFYGQYIYWFLFIVNTVLRKLGKLRFGFAVLFHSLYSYVVAVIAIVALVQGGNLGCNASISIYTILAWICIANAVVRLLFDIFEAYYRLGQRNEDVGEAIGNTGTTTCDSINYLILLTDLWRYNVFICWDWSMKAAEATYYTLVALIVLQAIIELIRLFSDNPKLSPIIGSILCLVATWCFVLFVATCIIFANNSNNCSVFAPHIDFILAFVVWGMVAGIAFTVFVLVIYMLVPDIDAWRTGFSYNEHDNYGGANYDYNSNNQFGGQPSTAYNENFYL